MNRILVQKSRELTEEELLKAEEINVFTRSYENEEEKEEDKATGYVLIRFYF
jgi:hypothetical protein